MVLLPGGGRRNELWTLPSAGDPQASHLALQTSVGKKLLEDGPPQSPPVILWEGRSVAFAWEERRGLTVWLPSFLLWVLHGPRFLSTPLLRRASILFQLVSTGIPNPSPLWQGRGGLEGVATSVPISVSPIVQHQGVCRGSDFQLLTSNYIW